MRRLLGHRLVPLLAGSIAIALLVVVYHSWLNVTNPTIVALSFLLIVLLVASGATRWVAIATSLLAFASFNFFFLPPIRTFTIAEPENWVALFTLLAVSIVASHLSATARRQAQDAVARRDELARMFEERTHLLQQRNEAEVLRRSAELKSALLASLGHDLKTPLTAVTLAAANLNASWLSDDQRREQAAIVISELERLNRLFRDIVDMAKIETHAVVVESEWVQPSEIVEAAARQIAPALDHHVFRMEDDAEKMFVRIDPRLTSAALAHLLENAAQYSPVGSEIVVGVSVLAEELRLAVRDRGRGVATEDFERLFDRFFRGSASGQHRFGTGMGLAITRGLVAAAGGRVWAENAPGGGARFTIAIPVDIQPATALAAPEV
jgi:two-component system sensor histidine kinase KdpD